jgi:hypothetical protein
MIGVCMEGTIFTSLERQYEAKKRTVHSSASIPCLTLYAFFHHNVFCQP